jgi:hypothetical protein
MRKRITKPLADPVIMDGILSQTRAARGVRGPPDPMKQNLSQNDGFSKRPQGGRGFAARVAHLWPKSGKNHRPADAGMISEPRS